MLRLSFGFTICSYSGIDKCFVDERRHRYRRLPEVDQGLISMYSERQKEANARTTKKVIEAKARKKRRFMKKQEKLRLLYTPYKTT